MELQWYDIRELTEDAALAVMDMMDETRRRRVADIAGEDDRKRTVAGELLARQMLASLAANYAVKPGTLGSGQLLHGTYSKKSPYNTCTPEGVDECTSWGDYFYMEALTRLTKDWEMYW